MPVSMSLLPLAEGLCDLHPHCSSSIPSFFSHIPSLSCWDFRLLFFVLYRDCYFSLVHSSYPSSLSLSGRLFSPFPFIFLSFCRLLPLHFSLVLFFGLPSFPLSLPLFFSPSLFPNLFTSYFPPFLR